VNPETPPEPDNPPGPAGASGPARSGGRVSGKVALITGAGRGQGRSHAVCLAEEGADVIAIDICEDVASAPYPMSTKADLDETVAQVRRLGRRAAGMVADVRDYPALQSAVDKAVAAVGRLDIVAANAAISAPSAAGSLAIEARSWQDTIDINLTGVWNTCRAVVPHLRASGGGAITITSSVGGLKGYANVGDYVAAKHGVVGLMRTLAVELAPDGIRVNTVHPTQVETTMIMNESMFSLFSPGAAHLGRDKFARVSQAMHLIPIPWIQPRDVSNAVLFLSSDEARYVTGVTLPIDAGALQK
jgi:(+)-trans-carveol dehydrogenase